MKAWFEFFRLPNLPTAPGDALAGAAFLLAALPEVFSATPERILAAGGAAMFFYLFGLADNDIVGLAFDREHAPMRPLPRGAISLGAARLARVFCLIAAAACGGCARLPLVWWCVAAALVGMICLYNRVKGTIFMGLCRGLSLLAGGASVYRPGTVRLPVVFTVGDPGLSVVVGAFALAFVALGWTLYIAAVTKLSEGEECASEGLGNRRYVLGLAAFVPLLALVPVVCYRLQLPDPNLTLRFLLLPIFGSFWTFITWCAAVSPLWFPHGPAERRRAVGQTIGALLYLQVGFMLMASYSIFVVLAVLFLVSARLIRRLAPTISGS